MIQQRKNEEAQIVATLRPRIAGVHMKEDSLPVLDASLSFPDAPDCFRPQELHVTKIQIPIAMRRLSSHSNQASRSATKSQSSKAGSWPIVGGGGEGGT